MLEERIEEDMEAQEDNPAKDSLTGEKIMQKNKEDTPKEIEK